MSPAPPLRLELHELDDCYSILRFPPSPRGTEVPYRGDAAFRSITSTDGECSVICATRSADDNEGATAAAPIDRSDGWRCLRINATSSPSDVPGILASVIGPLADAGVSVFAVASFDTDHVLVQQIDAAHRALLAAGHLVVRSADSSFDADSSGSGHRGSNPALDAVCLRDALERDGADLAILADAATRRLLSWTWDEHTRDGQSSFEVGRTTILSDRTSLSHLANWAVAEVGGGVAGALNSYRLPPTTPSTSTRSKAILQPLAELKAIAEGSWYVSVASVHTEFRGQGVGQALLSLAELKAREAEANAMTLLVGSFNEDAHRLYLRLGFTEWHRRSFEPFPGSDRTGDWILMAKDL